MCHQKGFERKAYHLHLNISVQATGALATACGGHDDRDTVRSHLLQDLVSESTQRRIVVLLGALGALGALGV